MNYWMTTHWPPREYRDDDSHSGVYLPDGRQQAGRDLRIGNFVLIYESLTGRPEVRRTDIEGNVRIVECC